VTRALGIGRPDESITVPLALKLENPCASAAGIRPPPTLVIAIIPIATDARSFVRNPFPSFNIVMPFYHPVFGYRIRNKRMIVMDMNST
jgi:hypothetical protein